MRKHSVLIVLLFVVMFVMADARLPFFVANWETDPQHDDPDTTFQLTPIEDKNLYPDDYDEYLARQKAFEGVAPEDTMGMDSLQLEVFRHNKVIDDSIRLDSLNKRKKNTIESPVEYSAEDSIVYDAQTKTAHLYGSASVDYQVMNLTSDKMYLSLDSNIVHAMGSYTDSTMTKIEGKPVFKMGSDTYENDTIAFNFKTKKGVITNVYTEQEDGFLWSEKAKRDSSGVNYFKHGRYTTCDAEHPDFYIAISRGKMRPGKDVVFGPAYLVVCDVPLPLAIPYGFFPFTKSYSSGFIMPTYGDESTRGFYLRDGGYYFAMSDKWDLKLLGEIYTKGSWGISAASNYHKRYKYSGSVYFNYQNTKSGDKGMPDFMETESFKLQWSHRQDAKANPFNTLSAQVNFATSSYERNNLGSLYNPQSMTQSTRTSSVSWTTNFSSIGLSLSGTANVAQNMRDTTISLKLPDLNISLARFYPFRRKHVAGKERWYEKISVYYTGQFSNSIDTKENMLMHSNLVKDWKNGMNHKIPISGSFTLFDYININPSFNFTDRMYTSKVKKSWDTASMSEVTDTLHGFYNVYNWDLSMSASTKLYGMYLPSRKIFGNKVQAIRHVFTPSVSFSYAPDFSSSRYGYYQTYTKTDAEGNVSLVDYQAFQNALFGMPGKGKTGSISLDIGNNIEMKLRSDEDSTGFKKISIIDELGASMSYNMAAKERPLSDLNVRLRLKWWKHYTFNMNAQFATYAYELDENGTPYLGTHTEYGYGRFGRFQGTSQNFSLTLNPENLKKWFGKKEDRDDDRDD
ncbi:MAG: LPS-assembly protein LptD, partial [Prevotella sp.]|nr:LPS-assembly protein LptD [Prevotella sp.]